MFLFRCSRHFMPRFVNLTRESDGYANSAPLSPQTTEMADTLASSRSSLPRSRITPCAVIVMARLCHVAGSV